MTCDNGNVSLYLNGSFESSGALVYNKVSHPIELGARTDSAPQVIQFIDGYLTDASIYKSILTSTEINDLYHGIKPNIKPILWLPMDREGQISYSQDTYHRRLETFGHPIQRELSK
jgi:hypothetical protein